MKPPKEEFVTSNIEITPDLLDEIKHFFPIFPENSFKYGILQLKVKEIDESTKEIILESKKKPVSRIIKINDQYSDEEVIFYTYVLLHAEYDWYSNKKDSNLTSFCLSFFAKAEKFTLHKVRDVFVNSRVFEMFLFCSIKNKVDYDLPPYEELWRVFLEKENLLPSSYTLLFNNEKNTVRKFRISEKAFECFENRFVAVCDHYRNRIFI
ncbi:MAG: hypothetical protein QG614_75 [Patescibacteria group bacterium]|nr:hypothetical protein [Patescibacteria group bacterium]